MFSEETIKYAIRFYEIYDTVPSAERISKINQIFDISQTSFFRHYMEYKDNLNKENPNEPTEKTPKERKRKCTDQILKYVRIIMNLHKTISIKRVIYLIKDKYNVSISK